MLRVLKIIILYTLLEFIPRCKSKYSLCYSILAESRSVFISLKSTFDIVNSFFLNDKPVIKAKNLCSSKDNEWTAKTQTRRKDLQSMYLIKGLVYRIYKEL